MTGFDTEPPDLKVLISGLGAAAAGRKVANLDATLWRGRSTYKIQGARQRASVRHVYMTSHGLCYVAQRFLSFHESPSAPMNGTFPRNGHVRRRLRPSSSSPRSPWPVCRLLSCRPPRGSGYQGPVPTRFGPPFPMNARPLASCGKCRSPKDSHYPQETAKAPKFRASAP